MEVLSRCYGTSSIPVPDVIRLTLTGDVEGLSRCLTQTGCSPDTVDAERRRTGLHHAAARGLDGVMSALLSAGADPNFRDVHGNTPLHLCGHAMTLALLINYGADPRLTNTTGVTALEMMRRRGVADEIVGTLAVYEERFDEEEIIVGDAEEDEEYGEDDVAEKGGSELGNLRQRRALNVPIYDSMEREPSEEDYEAIEHSLRERLISPEGSDVVADRVHYQNGNAVFTIMTGCRGGRLRRRRGFPPAVEDLRPLSILHEFFLSMDRTTLILFVFIIFCLALFAAFYVTGVHMNYFRGLRETEEKIVTGDER